MGRISGPLLDRMDMHVEVPRVKFKELQDQSSGATSEQMRSRVNAARERQAARFSGLDFHFNSQMKPVDIRKYCALDQTSRQMLKKAFESLNMSARGYDRILKVARTIADLEDCETIQSVHIAEALRYRSLDRKYWNM